MHIAYYAQYPWQSNRKKAAKILLPALVLHTLLFLFVLQADSA
jgi:hypothetical protein